MRSTAHGWKRICRRSAWCARVGSDAPKEALEAIAEEFKEASVDLMVMVYGAFTGDDAAAYFHRDVKYSHYSLGSL